jgi:hypothetical protein
VVFNPPSNFHDLRNNQKMELKVNSYNNLMSTQKVSDTYAKKKVLNWKDKDILADRELRRKDAELEWEIQQIMALGPNWKEQLLQQANAGTPPGGDMGGAPAGGGMPPAFGGGEAALGLEEPPMPPNAGVEPEMPVVPEEPPA